MANGGVVIAGVCGTALKCKTKSIVPSILLHDTVTKKSCYKLKCLFFMHPTVHLGRELRCWYHGYDTMSWHVCLVSPLGNDEQPTKLPYSREIRRPYLFLR